MGIEELIQPRTGFQTSVNLAYDLKRADKIKDFVPTTASMKVLEKLMLPTAPGASERAHILIGAYGKGKSHLVLVLLAMLAKKHKEELAPVVRAMLEYKEELGRFAGEQLLGERQQPLLPVVIDGSQGSLSQAFLSALQGTLSQAGMEDLMPETHFEAAIKQIELWEKKFPETYAAMKEKLSDSPKEFKDKLASFDGASYENFLDIYPQLTSGSVFNPFLGFNIVELYARTAEAVKSKGYRGLYVVYDEFSKFLEANIASAGVSDTRLLQDFAEKSGRSGQAQLHLLLIAHKDIANYLDRLPKNKLDGWQAVSERFVPIEMRNSFVQSYELMGRVLVKKEKYWQEFWASHGEELLALAQQVEKCRILSDAADASQTMEACYPLHPLTIFLLPRLSDLIAQNERTLFTFLSRNSKHTLVDFLGREEAGNGLSFLTPEWLFDYFEPLFRQEAYTSQISGIYRLAMHGLANLELDSLMARLVKTVALIQMVQHFEQVPPTAEILELAYGRSWGTRQVVEALNELVDKKYLLHKSQVNGYLSIKQASGVDVKQKCKDLAEKNKSAFGLLNVLNELCKDVYFYPTQYNDEKDMTRYFELRFVTEQAFMVPTDWNKEIGDACLDGVVYALVPGTEADGSFLRTKLETPQKGADRCLFILPKVYHDIQEAAYIYQSAKQLTEDAKDDAVLADEYRLAMSDAEEALTEFLRNYLEPERGRAEYYHQGRKLSIKRRAQFSKALSDICSKLYHLAPIINNETLNRNTLSIVALRTRDKVIEALLRQELAPNLGQKGNSQGMSFVRSALLHTGILFQDGTRATISLDGLAEPNVQRVIHRIEAFISSADGSEKYNFSRLYGELRLPAGHIAMKKGPIPIFLAAVVHFYRSNIAIYNQNGREEEINAGLFRAIEAHPEKYRAFREDWNEEKSEYINKICDIFSEHMLGQEREYASFSFIVKAMQRWFLSLPNYTRQTRNEELSEACLKLMQSLGKPHINAREYLFHHLPQILSGANLSETAVKLNEAKNLLDASKDALMNRMKYELIHILGENVQEATSLPSAMMDWLETLPKSAKQHVFSGTSQTMLEAMMEPSMAEKELLERIARAVSGLRINDWDDSKEADFLSKVRTAKQEIESYHADTEESLAGGNAIITNGDDYLLAYMDCHGNKRHKTFHRVEVSPRARLLRNEIDEALETMGAALSVEEKRQVLLEALSETL
ncbi:MAG: hypothetical protein IKR28_03625 [Selenomonadaceae bacterium]|nr:hypothetical protein [Selenomonadaceae bacterium]